MYIIIIIIIIISLQAMSIDYFLRLCTPYAGFQIGKHQKMFGGQEARPAEKA